MRKQKTRKIATIILSLVMLMSLSMPVMAENTVSVYLNNERIQFDVEPKVVNGRTMVPMRAIFEKLGAEVTWDAATNTAHAYNYEKKQGVSITIGAPHMVDIFMNVIPLDVPSMVENGRTLVPLRAVSEAFKCDVQWDGATSTVNIYSENSQDTTPTRQNVMIFERYIDMNSVDGVTAEIIWRNNSGKSIKYINFYAVPYNAVDDPVSCEISGQSEQILKATGPFYAFDINNLGRYPYIYNDGDRQFVETDKATGQHYIILDVDWDAFEVWEDPVYKTRYLTADEYDDIFDIKCEWDPIWYNSSIKYIKITKVKVEYMDGTSEEINNPPIWRDIYKNAGM
ncbi:MAG: copper amine oxidase N-terminal domain-containing protein [Candidatus Ornithomonoglobus sp.]